MKVFHFGTQYPTVNKSATAYIHSYPRRMELSTAIWRAFVLTPRLGVQR
jgi:hypothetical protein